MLPFFDAHSHLPLLDSPHLEHHQVICGTCEADWEAVLAHAESDSGAIPMLGLHPWFVEEASPGWNARLELLLRAHTTGVGECGLDFARKETDHAAQEAAFRIQLRLAHLFRRPAALHVVRAWGRTIEILREEGVPQAGALVHAFAGSPEMALTLQSMGIFLSFSGDILEPGRSRMRRSLRAVAASSLLLETDGTADLASVLQAAAELRGQAIGDLAAQTWENGRRCFKECLA